MKKLIFAFLFMTLGFVSFANDEDDCDGDDSTNVEMGRKEDLSAGFPKKPSAQRIQCIYSNGEMFIFFAIPEGECKITVYDYITGNIKWYVEDSNEDIVIQTGKLKSAGIEILTENGHLYSGEF